MTREIRRPARSKSKRSAGSGKSVAVPSSSSVLKKPERLFERLREYQKTAVNFSLTRPGAALFCDPRTGKTWIALSIIQESKAQRGLIVVPLTNKNSTWLKLITELLPEYSVTSDYNDYKKLPNPKLFVIHYEELRGVSKKIANQKWDLVIADECQRLKSRNSKQSRDLRRLRHVDRRIGLSGTPIDGDPIDLWGQMRFIQPLALGENWGHFEAQFLRKTGYMGYKREFIEERRDDFNNLIEPHCLRVTRDEAGIAEPTMIWCGVPLLGRQAAFYERLNRDWIASIGQSDVTVKLEVSKMVKLQQITGGFVYDDTGNEVWLGEAKERKLRHLLKRKITKPAVIFTQFIPEIGICYDVCREFSDRVECLHGAVKDTKNSKARTEIIERFQAGEIDYLICQQRTGGVGIDLYRARNAIVYSHNHSFIDFDQMKSRLDVVNSEPPTIFLIYAVESIDADKKDAVMSKRSITDVILDRLKQRR